jgi:hypothetical protein
LNGQFEIVELLGLGLEPEPDCWGENFADQSGFWLGRGFFGAIVRHKIRWIGG